VMPGRFSFTWELPRRPRVAIHPEASNPNRRWISERWAEVAYELRDRGCEIIWLGTRDEFGFSARGIQKLSDENTKLLWQIRQLARCSYFVGCDSGFAHAAGLLGIPGAVLFGNTHPDDVIASYPALKGIHDLSGHDEPSRSLRVGCKKSEAAMDRLTVEKVLQAIPYQEKVAAQEREEQTMPTQIKVAVVGQSLAEEARELSQWFAVDHLTNVPQVTTDYDAVVCMRQDRICLMLKTRRVFVRHSVEDIRRTLRELIQT